MTYPVQVDHLDLVGLQIQLGRLHRNSPWNLGQLIPRTTHNRSSARARGRAITLAQTSLVRISITLELVVWQFTHGNLSHLLGSGTPRHRPLESMFPQPVREPGQVAVAVERIRSQIQAAQRHQVVKGAGHHARNQIIVQRQRLEIVQSQEHLVVNLRDPVLGQQKLGNLGRPLEGILLDTGNAVPPHVQLDQVRQPSKQTVRLDAHQLVIVEQQFGRVQRNVPRDFLQAAS